MEDRLGRVTEASLSVVEGLQSLDEVSLLGQVVGMPGQQPRLLE